MGSKLFFVPSVVTEYVKVEASPLVGPDEDPKELKWASFWRNEGHWYFFDILIIEHFSCKTSLKFLHLIVWSFRLKTKSIVFFARNISSRKIHFQLLRWTFDNEKIL